MTSSYCPLLNNVLDCKEGGLDWKVSILLGQADLQFEEPSLAQKSPFDLASVSRYLAAFVSSIYQSS